MIEAIIFDYARTVTNPDIDPPILYPDVIPVLDRIKAKGIKMALVSRGQDVALRRNEIERLGLNAYFDIIHIVGQEADKDFSPVIKELKVDASKCMVVGDRIRQEIKYGNQVGTQTIWLRRAGEKFANEYPQSQEEEPNSTINSLEELILILIKY